MCIVMRVYRFIRTPEHDHDQDEGCKCEVAIGAEKGVSGPLSLVCSPGLRWQDTTASAFSAQASPASASFAQASLMCLAFSYMDTVDVCCMNIHIDMIK